ncbi:hypothetical protein OYT13_11440 [Pandoraea sp. XJJ-1]|uniref:hypothetical protein n=1 Tax=Pandoraea sp. XJJ-1 TaxID=3002643 RepID=UPI00227DF491|nr:hypothetical protein [Pandoraea sp. XJJ-1]WAL84960.1 hypothetical protein OYT13_11440 [Pandoraea sp. XJJ-1]
MSYVLDSNGNQVWVDDTTNTQPASYYSDPVTQQGTDLVGQRVGDVLTYGLMRAIDVASINALQPSNTMVLTQPQSVLLGTNGPVAASSSRGLLVLLAVGALFLMAEHKA